MIKAKKMDWNDNIFDTRPEEMLKERAVMLVREFDRIVKWSGKGAAIESFFKTYMVLLNDLERAKAMGDKSDAYRMDEIDKWAIEYILRTHKVIMEPFDHTPPPKNRPGKGQDDQENGNIDGPDFNPLPN